MRTRTCSLASSDVFAGELDVFAHGLGACADELGACAGGEGRLWEHQPRTFTRAAPRRTPTPSLLPRLQSVHAEGVLPADAAVTGPVVRALGLAGRWAGRQ